MPMATVTAIVITATERAPTAHRIGIIANQRGAPASAACRTDARCAAVSRSSGVSSKASRSTADAAFSSSTSARASGDDLSRRSTASESALSSSPSTYAVHFGSFGLIRVMTGSCGVFVQMAADRAHRGMKKEPHVARRERRDGGDFLVAQTTVKLQVYDFTLIAGERLEHVEDPAERLPGVVLRVEVVDHRHLGMVERR